MPVLFPSVSTGGGSGPAEPAFSDAVALKLLLSDSNVVPTDAVSLAIALALADSSVAPTEAVALAFPAPDFSDTNVAPTEAKSFALRCWLSASAGAGVTSPGNADGQNNGTIATLQTVPAGAKDITMTSTLGPNIPTATITSAIYRGWFKSVNTLVTSSGVLVMHSLSALFGDITMFTNAALNTTIDHLSGDFTFDLVAAGVDTLAKLQSCQMIHATHDTGVAGVTPHVLTVDAGCVEIAGAFT